MASIAQRIKMFLKSPQGQRVVTQGQQQLAKPQTQNKLREFANRLSRKR